MEEAEKIMTEWTAVPFEMEDAPMNRIVIIKTPDGNQGLYLLANHLILDAQSLICFLKDVIELYCNVMFENNEYPKEMRSYIEQLKKDLEYEAGSKAQQRDREYFHKLIEQSEPNAQNEIFRHTNFDPVEYGVYRSRLYPVEPGRSYDACL